MTVQDRKSPAERRWRRVIDPLRKPGEGPFVPRTVEDRWLSVAVLVVGLLILTPAWIALLAWALLRLSAWLLAD